MFPPHSWPPISGRGAAFQTLAVWGETESAHRWDEVVKDLRRRGVKSFRVFVSDDLFRLKGAMGKIFPRADGQRCVLPTVRESLELASNREGVAQALKANSWAEARS